MRRLCWIFPDRGTERQRRAEQSVFWEPYRRAAKRVGLALGYHQPEAVAVVAADAGHPSVYLDGELVTPADTIFVTELYTLPHQAVDAFNQVALFAVLEQLGFYLPIPPRLSYIGNDKLATLLYLRDAPVPAVPSVRVGTGRDVAEFDLSAMLGELMFPVVVKPAGWGCGQGLCVARNAEDLWSVASLAAGSDCPLVIQPYLGPATTDYRVYLVAGQPHTVVMRRPRGGGYVANAARGGEIAVVPLPDELADAVGYFVRRLPIPYVCVDFLHDGERFWFSEIEPDGALGYFPEDVTGRLLEARFAAYARAHARWLDSRGAMPAATVGAIP